MSQNDPFNPDPNDIVSRMAVASGVVMTAQGTLANAIESIGFSRKYVGHEPAADLRLAIENYARAVARHEMLVILSSQDFFLAMARSAGASNLDP